MDGKVINILLVEDDKLDVIDMQRTLDKMNILHKVAVARNGEEAVEYLNNVERSENPDVILLDVNMPKMNGFEFLTYIRGHETWRDLKVFMVTTSDERIDRELAKRLKVSGYIVKPLKLNNPSSIDSFNLMIDLMNMKTR
jgi:CheY-like chemotaxis protein